MNSERVPPNIEKLARQIDGRPQSQRVIEVLRLMAQMSPKQLDAFINKAEEIYAAKKEGR